LFPPPVPSARTLFCDFFCVLPPRDVALPFLASPPAALPDEDSVPPLPSDPQLPTSSTLWPLHPLPPRTSPYAVRLCEVVVLFVFFFSAFPLLVTLRLRRRLLGPDLSLFFNSERFLPILPLSSLEIRYLNGSYNLI